MSSLKVQLLATEPGEPLCFDAIPCWLTDAWEQKRLPRVVGDSVDGTDWVYVNVLTPAGWELCRTDEFIRYNPEDDTLAVTHREGS